MDDLLSSSPTGILTKPLETTKQCRHIKARINKLCANRDVFINKDRYRGKKRYEDISRYITSRVCRYVDIGAGNGIMTKYIGKSLGLNRWDIIGADVKYWCGLENGNSSIVYVYIKNEKIPIVDKSTNLITIFQTLHHIKNCESLLNDVCRIMALDGTLIIREHDCQTEYDKNLIDLDHYLYSGNVDCYTSYKSAKEWNNFITSFGFDLVEIVYPEKNRGRLKKESITSCYYAIYKFHGKPEIDKEAKMPIDKEAKMPIDKEAKMPIDKEAKMPIDKEAKIPIDKEAKIPIDREAKTPTNH
ncbi:MAG: methyltransferase domain-containing protein [Candidatus Aenigmarchaeota archaeon]|nr:methyltransferase domain-containing protein [Candidatus Aenigmarchaeota archaeon]